MTFVCLLYTYIHTYIHCLQTQFYFKKIYKLLSKYQIRSAKFCNRTHLQCIQTHTPESSEMLQHDSVVTPACVRGKIERRISLVIKERNKFSKGGVWHTYTTATLTAQRRDENYPRSGDEKILIKTEDDIVMSPPWRFSNKYTP
jgi:hypothetical protein